MGAATVPLAGVEFDEFYGVKRGSEDWDTLEEDKWSVYKRLETFRRLVAWYRGEKWRGFTHRIGAPILYPGFSQKLIDAVTTSPQVKRAISSLAQQRASALLVHVHDGKLSPDYLRAYLKDPTSGEVPPVDTTKLAKPETLNKLLGKAYTPEISAVQQFYTDVHMRLVRELVKRTKKMVENASSRMDSAPFSRFFGAAVNEILVSMYNYGTHVRHDQVMALRKIALEAAKKKQSIVFVPCHKSHIDYLVFSFILYRIGICLPNILAGENLDLPVAGTILRQGGAVFIRRSFQGDQLYPLVMKEYIMQLFADGQNIEFFIEGTRSRTGKLLTPKYGILKYMMQALRENRTSDLLICPVSLQYDSVIEAETYVDELLGKPKKSESLYDLVAGGSAILQLKMGRIDARFKEPWSMREYMQREEAYRTDEPSNDSDNQILKSLGYQILSDINSVSVIMPAALVGTVILTMRGRGIGRAALIKGVARLRERILENGYEVANFGLNSIAEIVDRTLSHMKDLIEEHKGLLEVTFQPVKMFELSFYRNQIMHIFVHESLICVSLYMYVKQGGPTEMQRIDFESMYNACQFLSKVLRDEFVFGTMQLDRNIEKTVQQLIDDNILQVTAGDNIDAEGLSVHDWRAGNGLLGLADEERRNGRQNFDIYLFLIWPYVESYWLAAVSILGLAPQSVQVRPAHDAGSVPEQRLPWYMKKDLVTSMQKIGNTLFWQGELSYYEAINSATLVNALARMEQMGVVVYHKPDDKKAGTFAAVDPSWVPTAIKRDALQPDQSSVSVSQISYDYVLVGPLVDIIERLVRFRREGKDRRDQSGDSHVFEHAFAGSPRIMHWAPVGASSGVHSHL
ncbi:hypothetical protein MVES1_002703 [Malassezia vespertilionis]|uniref:Phospholipid/glycerol acyltransferase domain-containing protein n=1 Tax=Malassezia vespertilionis TaxID=2020962 RepID=A0A2N1JAZ2_9BASI|nr:uncharacterized protein MVES1_002703 [Malassezia vespertilionis]PKI83716.1 hypothetical protein MVES_002554 [Malassezia vespertilionis]WFD07340.1 hypothetical protein MVES1_002703 [Malassezia vespertilionis]